MREVVLRLATMRQGIGPARIVLVDQQQHIVAEIAQLATGLSKHGREPDIGDLREGVTQIGEECAGQKQLLGAVGLGSVFGRAEASLEVLQLRYERILLLLAPDIAKKNHPVAAKLADRLSQHLEKIVMTDEALRNAVADDQVEI